MSRAIIADEETWEVIREILIASTQAGKEAAGSCAARRATAAEVRAADVPEEDVWVLSDFRVDITGTAWSVPLPPVVDGRWQFHTHPGLQFAIGYFSEQDERASTQVGRPLLVLGYTSLGPELMSFAALPMGWTGALVAGAVQLGMRLEASQQIPLTLLKRGVVARVFFPGGLVLPVRQASATPIRRAWEEVSFQADKAATTTERTARATLNKLWHTLKTTAERK